MTLNARNIHKAMKPFNLLISSYENIETKLENTQIFSKIDFKFAFWQLKLHLDSRFITMFYVNTKVHQCMCLTMAVKPAQEELNSALRPLFAHIPHVHSINDDLILIIAAPNEDEHNLSLEEVMKSISTAGITLNPGKCTFRKSEVKYWGLIISNDGIRIDPHKVNALQNITRPKTKDEIINFICMMKSDADFIPNFTKEAEVLGKLIKTHTKYEWQDRHQQAFKNLLCI